MDSTPVTESISPEAAELLEEHGIPTDTAQALRDKLGEVYVMTKFPVLFRRPTRAAWRAFQDDVSGKGSRSEALDKFAMSTIVYPSAKELVQLLDKWPGITAIVADEAGGLAKGISVDQGKAL